MSFPYLCFQINLARHVPKMVAKPIVPPMRTQNSIVVSNYF